MDLLMEIKGLYTLLVEVKMVDKMPNLHELEEIAEECYHHKYNKLKDFFVPGLATEKYNAIYNHIEKIKELTK